MDFEIIEGITQADVAFRIYGKDLNELFFSGSKALLSVMIRNIESVYDKYDKIEKKIELENENIELLLFDFLQEIIFFKDSESLILVPKSLEIIKSGNVYKLICMFYGEGIDNIKHQISVDVKAVTFHSLKVENKGDNWAGMFVLDV